MGIELGIKLGIEKVLNTRMTSGKTRILRWGSAGINMGIDVGIDVGIVAEID